MKRFLPRTWMYDAIFGLLMLALVGLAARQIMLVRQGRPRALEAARTQEKVLLSEPARPGNIYAKTFSKYILLASSKQVPYCYADPSLIKDEQLADAAIGLGEVLAMDPRQVQDLLVSRRDGRFVRIKEDLRPEEVQAVQKMRNSPFGIKYDWRRDYPNGQLASNVIGFRMHDGEAGEGLELGQDEHLAAADGLSVSLADARRRRIWPVPDLSRPPRDGSHVFLTIDAVIQGYLEKAVAAAAEKFEPKWVIGIVANCQTGEILGMCSLPTFNPNEYNKTDPASRTNRAICLPYEPGSAFKPIVAAAAIEAGVVRWDTMINCEGGLYNAMRGGVISDHGSHYGLLSVNDIIVKSSNIGMAKVGEKLGNQAMFRTVNAFGFGADTGIGLPGESAGIVRKLRDWDGYSLRRVPFGQEISVTGLQLTMAYCALANGGLLLKPRLIDHVCDPQGRVIWRSRTEVVRRVISPQTSQQMVAVMRQVVDRKDGTGHLALSDRWTIFGKTGTAQIPGVGGYAEGAFTGSFVGGAPASSPWVLCLISVYWPNRSKGHFGATVAAPYVKEVLEETLSYLDIPPDRTDDPKLPGNAVVAAKR